MLSAIWLRRFQYAFLAIIVTTVGFSLYQWNASRASTQKTAPNNGLVGYWSFDEGTGTLAGDSSVNKNTGTLTNGPTWVDGRLGKAVSVDGVNDYIDMGNASALKPTFPFSVSTWAMIPSGGSAVMITTADTVSPVGEYSGYSVAIATNQIVAMVGNNAGWCSGSYRNTYVTNSTTLNVNQWYHVTAVFTNASSFSVYVNGSSVALTQSGTNGISIGYAAGVPLRIGRRFNSCPDTTYYDKGIVDELRIYNRALSGTEITNLYNLGAEKLNISPTASLTSGLVGYWTFDGKDTPWSSSSAGTATDRSGNSNTGTLTNMSQSTSPVIGKLGQALNFNGTNQYISVPQSASVNTMTAVTVSAWVNITNSSGNAVIVRKNNNTGSTNHDLYQLDFNAGHFRFSAAANGSGVKTDTGTITIVNNNWYHVVGVYDGANVRLYVNGVADGTPAALTGTISTGTSLNIGIGTDIEDASGYLPGQIDEVRIYNRALSATEVQSLYDLGASDKVNSSVSQNQGTGRLDSGLVGYWKLDDGSGTTATDSSTNANNGTLTSGPTWTTGKIGSAVDFTGTKYITIPNSTPLRVTGDMTVSFWMYLRGYGAGGWNPIINKFSTDISNEFNIRFQTSSTGQFYSGGSGGINTFLTWDPSADAGLNNWVHVVARRNITAGTMDMWFNGIKKRSGGASGLTDATTQPLQFGGGPNGGAGGVDFNGLLDEVRVYNRAISDEEITQLYRLTTPTGVDTSLKGYWSFNGSDISGTTAYDRSGNANNGTLTNSPTKTIGKIGQALSFDGTDDYATTPDSDTLDVLDSTNFSLSGWFSRNTFTTDDTIIAKSNGQASSDTGYNAYIDDTTDKLTFVANDGTDQYKIESVSTFTATGWHHFTLVWDDASSANTKLYIDGTSEAATTTGTFANVNSLANALTFRIGAESDNGNPFDGKIDEVRVYNRALSSTEVSALYNVGR